MGGVVRTILACYYSLLMFWCSLSCGGKFRVENSHDVDAEIVSPPVESTTPDDCAREFRRVHQIYKVCGFVLRVIMLLRYFSNSSPCDSPSRL